MSNKPNPASNRSKARLRHMLWTMLREVGGSDIEMESNPLAARYEVNRHQIDVSGDLETLRDVQARFMALVSIHCWTVKAEDSITFRLTPPHADDEPHLTVWMHKVYASPRDETEGVLKLGVS
jgi:hypothetical protein